VSVNLQLYFAPGACSFVPHVGLEERVQKMLPQSGYWLGERVSFLDAYAVTLFRWGGFAGIDPRSLPLYHAHAERILRAPPLAVAAARERIALDTYKG
jgi:glutathione S-transferase